MREPVPVLDLVRTVSTVGIPTGSPSLSRPLSAHAAKRSVQRALRHHGDACQAMAREACRLVADPRPYPLGDRCEDGRIDEWPPGDGRVRKSSLSPGVSIARSHVVGARSLRWPTPYPNAEQWALGFGVSLCTLLLYFILFGRRHRCVVLTPPALLDGGLRSRSRRQATEPEHRS